MSVSLRVPTRVWLPALLGLALVSVLVLRTSSAAFTATTDNPGNEFATGQIALDDDAVGALFEVAGLTPGDDETRCITVTYTGTVASGSLGAVKLYAAGPTSDPDALAAALRVSVEEGTGASDAACTGFVAGPTIQATTPLSTFVATTTYEDGVGAWVPATSGEERSYRITVGLPADAADATQGRSLQGLTFVWELRSS